MANTPDIEDRIRSTFANIWELVDEGHKCLSKSSPLSRALQMLTTIDEEFHLLPALAGVKSAFLARMRAVFGNPVPVQHWAIFRYCGDVAGLSGQLEGYGGCVQHLPGSWLYFRIDEYIIFEFIDLHQFVDNFIVQFNPRREMYRSRLFYFRPSMAVFKAFASTVSDQCQLSEYGSLVMLQNILSLPEGATSSSVTRVQEAGSRNPDYVVRIAGTSARHMVVEVTVSKSRNELRRFERCNEKVRQSVTKQKDRVNPTSAVGQKQLSPGRSRVPYDLAMVHFYSVAKPHGPPLGPPQPAEEAFGGALCLLLYTEADEGFFESGPTAKMLKRK